MARNNKRGFVPHKHIAGNAAFVTRRYHVSSNNSTAIFAGDPVELNVNGHVQVIDTSGVSANELPILGIVGQVLDVNQRPLTHNLPSTGNFLNASTEGYVDVYDDPGIIFLVNVDATGKQADIGMFIQTTAGSANSSAGISGFQLKGSTAVASSVGHRFQVMRVGSNQLDGVDSFDGTFQDYEVRIANHQWNRTWNRVGSK